MKGMACAAYGVFLGLFLAASAPAFAGGAPGEIVTITGKVLGHVVAGEDSNLYESVPSPKAEALMDLSGKRVSVTGMLLNDCNWTCLMDVTGFSVLTDQATPPPPPAPVFVPAKKAGPVLPQLAEPSKAALPAPSEAVVSAPAATVPAAPTAPEPALPAGDPASFRAR